MQGTPDHGSLPLESSIHRLLRLHLDRYPLLQLEDLYKLLHQGVLGSEHAVTSPSGAREWLEREIAGLGPGPEEPLIDPISGDGRIARVHLRPFLAGGGDQEALLTAFVRTANEHHGSRREFEAAWHLAESLAGHDEARAMPGRPTTDEATATPILPPLPDGPADIPALAPPPLLPFSRAAMSAFFAPLEAAGVPAVHHSEVFERAYAPAYRVVRLELLEL
jgi:hypothetical protein